MQDDVVVSVGNWEFTVNLLYTHTYTNTHISRLMSWSLERLEKQIKQLWMVILSQNLPLVPLSQIFSANGYFYMVVLFVCRHSSSPDWNIATTIGGTDMKYDTDTVSFCLHILAKFLYSEYGWGSHCSLHILLLKVVLFFAYFLW